ncbi:MAG: PD40 domain-containing protein [Phycisphaeraceae bacterium]|nr:PD40 domain-containing protein [Phycisphaeraceae bacterium]
MPRLSALEQGRSIGMIFAASLCTCTAAQVDEPEWALLEAPLLRDARQLTFDTQFVKAGEAYFSPDGRWVIFQAVPVPPKGDAPSPHYGMYLARVQFNSSGEITGLGHPVRICPEGSASTCGWFHPTQPGVVIFGSTLRPPEHADAPGYQRAGSRYAWSFPVEMEICIAEFDPELENPAMRSSPRPMFERPGYDAECSFSPDGRHVLYVNVDPTKVDKPDADIWVFDVTTGVHTPLVTAEGYDGGPFFSPDGRMICYRSDRDGNDLLQLFVAELKFDADGAIIGISRETKITDNQHVNWAPYWDPSGRYLLYTTSHVGHHNYELFAVDLPLANEATAAAIQPRKRRITFAEGFDGLAVFSPDGNYLMWTSQRTRDGGRGSSQLWVASYHPDTEPGEWIGGLTAIQAEEVIRRMIAHRQDEEAAMLALVVVESKDGEAWIVKHAHVGGAHRYRVTNDGHVEPIGAE